MRSEFVMSVILWVAVVVGTAMIILLLWAAGAVAHTAPQDCAQVPDDAVHEVEGGYSLTIRPGEHPMVPPHEQAVTHFIPHGDRRIRPSGDNHPHACVSAGGGFILHCLYVGPRGV